MGQARRADRGGVAVPERGSEGEGGGYMRWEGSGATREDGHASRRRGGGKGFRWNDDGKRTARDEDERYYAVSRMAHLEAALDSV